MIIQCDKVFCKLKGLADDFKCFKKKYKSAFTVAELVVTILILSFLVFILLGFMNRDQQKEFDAKIDKTVANISALLDRATINDTGKSSDYAVEEIQLILANQGNVINNEIRLNIEEFNCGSSCWGANNIQGINDVDTRVVLLNDKTSIAFVPNTQKIYIDANNVKGPNIIGKDIKELNYAGPSRSIGTPTTPGGCVCSTGTEPCCLPPEPSCFCDDGSACPGGIYANCPKPPVTPCLCDDGSACPGGIYANCPKPPVTPCLCDDGSACPDGIYANCPKPPVCVKNPANKANATWNEPDCKWICNTTTANSTYSSPTAKPRDRWAESWNASNCTYGYTCKTTTANSTYSSTTQKPRDRWAESWDASKCTYGYTCKTTTANSTYSSTTQKPRDLWTESWNASTCTYSYSCKALGNNQVWTDKSNCKRCTRGGLPANAQWGATNTAKACTWTCKKGYVKSRDGKKCITPKAYCDSIANGQVFSQKSNPSSVATVPDYDTSICTCFINGTSAMGGTGGFDGKYKYNGKTYSYKGWCSNGSDIAQNWHRNSECKHVCAAPKSTVQRISGGRYDATSYCSNIKDKNTRVKCKNYQKTQKQGDLEVKCYDNTTMKKEKWSCGKP